MVSVVEYPVLSSYLDRFVEVWVGTTLNTELDAEWAFSDSPNDDSRCDKD